MDNIQYFKTIPGTKYDEAIQLHFHLLRNWKIVLDRVGELLGEQLTRLALDIKDLYIDISELQKEENKEKFNENGSLNLSLQKSREVLDEYRKIIKECGLIDFVDFTLIQYIYGFQISEGQKIDFFFTSEEKQGYFKANFDLERSTRGMVMPISEIEYEEVYLDEHPNNQ